MWLTCITLLPPVYMHAQPIFCKSFCMLAESNPEEIALDDVDDGMAANPEELDIDGTPDDDEDVCGASMFAPVEIHNYSAGNPAAAANGSELPLPQALANVVAGSSR